MACHGPTGGTRSRPVEALHRWCILQGFGQHPDAYLDELEWRFGNRHNPILFRDALDQLLKAENLEYRKLVSQPA